ncbi:DUF6265 family protein [Gramella lutea]|uniref:DUF6265 family protein n=1 Tax=Christiangramia lutea TaxID=1607951 RepID=A0A9X1V1U2_9FLAO|nr:DUF6265 family protein [Christiangramia lutea]MCH4822675.1 DUF6265 family protein [Christiangramia lutea]
MKIYTIIFLCLIFSIANNKKEADLRQFQETENFDWILGEWIRTNGKKELITTETWKKTSVNIYEGTGLSMKNGEKVFRENLRILKKKNDWVYEVTGVNADTTNFMLTSISEDSFTAVNPENPFPKEINYRAENGNLIAEISDDGKRIIFEFKRSDQK